MKNRVHRFSTWNMSTPQVRKLFVILILGTAFIFMLTGLFAMIQAKRSVQSSDLGRITSHFSTETFLYLMGGEIPHLTTMEDHLREPGFSRIFFELVTSVDPKDPRTFLGSELPGFALFDTEIVVAAEDVDYTSIPIESPPPSDLEKKMGSKPKEKEKKKKKSSAEKKAGTPDQEKNRVYIYHTHYTESFLPELKGTDPNTAYDNKINIGRVGERFADSLEKLGIGSEVYTGGYQAEWNQLYQASREKVVAAMKQDKDLQYFIDIHRDSQRRGKTTKEIHGKNYARVALVIGTANPHWEKNEQLARKLHNKLNELYPGLSKGVFRKSRAMGNGEYNQSLSPNSLLMEVGGVDNTFAETYRTADALARALAEIHFDAVPVDGKAR